LSENCLNHVIVSKNFDSEPERMSTTMVRMVVSAFHPCGSTWKESSQNSENAIFAKREGLGLKFKIQRNSIH
jgi:hypothetical protein